MDAADFTPLDPGMIQAADVLMRRAMTWALQEAGGDREKAAALFLAKAKSDPLLSGTVLFYTASTLLFVAVEGAETAH